MTIDIEEYRSLDEIARMRRRIALLGAVAATADEVLDPVAGEPEDAAVATYEDSLLVFEVGGAGDVAFSTWQDYVDQIAGAGQGPDASPPGAETSEGTAADPGRFAEMQRQMMALWLSSDALVGAIAETTRQPPDIIESVLEAARREAEKMSRGA